MVIIYINLIYVINISVYLICVIIVLFYLYVSDLKFCTLEQDNSNEYSSAVYSDLKYTITPNDVKSVETNDLADVESKSVRKYIKEVERNLEKQNVLLGKQETDHQKEIVVLNEKLRVLEAEKLEQTKQIMDLQFVIDRNRQELNSIRSELEQHKARALKTLQEKEKLITELKSNAPTAMNEATIMELNQLQ